MKSRRRRFTASPRKLQVGKSYDERVTGRKRDVKRKANVKARKRRINRTNTLKARRRLHLRRPPLPYVT